MRVAILSDTHGNLPATEAVLADIAKQGVDHVVAAGDLALRGAHPRETVELLFDRCDAVIMGNTDAYIAGHYLSGAYREPLHWKRNLLEWTRRELGPELVARMGALPFSVRYTPRRGQDLFICHANPRNLEDSMDPTLDEATLRHYLQHVDAAAVAFGHLHFPYRRKVGRMLIADVASAGIPRDGDLRPAYGIFTWNQRGWRVQIRRVRYPVRKATQALNGRRVPGGPLLVHKLVEARYRHHGELQASARKHSGLPPLQRPALIRPDPSRPRPMEVIDAALDVEDSVPMGLALSREEGQRLLARHDTERASEGTPPTKPAPPGAQRPASEAAPPAGPPPTAAGDDAKARPEPDPDDDDRVD